MRVHRQIMDHWIYKDAEYFKAWMEMLLRARYLKDPGNEMVDGELITVHYGQFIFGRTKWSERLKVGEQRLRTLLKKLQNEGMVTLVSTHRKCTLYQICNYENYQNSIFKDESTSELLTKNNDAFFNHETNQQETQLYQGVIELDNHETNQHLTSSQPSPNQQLTTKEESKKEKKVKKKEVINKNTYAEFVTMTEDEYQKLVQRHGEHFTSLCIEKLDNHKGATGQRYASDYRAILKWVVDAVQKNYRRPNYQQSSVEVNTKGKTILKVVEGGPQKISDESRAEYRRMAQELDASRNRDAIL